MIETIEQIQKRTDLDRRGAALMRAEQLKRSAGVGQTCCDDPTPRLHDGKPYCQACDTDLWPAMQLWYVTATQPAPKGARKDRIHRFVVMAQDEGRAIALAKKERPGEPDWEWDAEIVEGDPVLSLGLIFDRR